MVATVLNCPCGYVRWLPDVNASIDLKLYVSNISEDIVQQDYFSFMKKISIEYLALFPKGKESLEATFFSSSTIFSSSTVLLENGSMVYNKCMECHL